MLPTDITTNLFVFWKSAVMKVFVSPLQNVMKLIEVMYNEEKGKIYMVSLVWQYDNQISAAMLA